MVKNNNQPDDPCAPPEVNTHPEVNTPLEAVISPSDEEVDAVGEDGGSLAGSAPILQRRVVLWTVTMIIVSTAACAFWLSQIAQHALTESNARHITSLGQALAAAVATDAGSSARHIDELFDSLAYDGRFAFVILTDSNGGVKHRRIFDAHAWSLYRQQIEKADRPADAFISQPTKLGDEPDLVVQKLPIFVPLEPGRIIVSDELPKRDLKGFVTLALSEPAVPQALWKLRVLHLAVAGCVCLLAVPIVIVAVNRWTRPLRKLLHATHRLAQGKAPKPVTVTTRDELKTLAESFNEMASAIITARRQLEEINQTLEHKVIERTSDLQHVNKRLESEIRDKNEFLRAVSHDLSAPLRNIEGMAKMLLVKYGKELTDDAKGKIDRITANVKTQTDLINDLLELSRIRTRPGKATVVDLNKLVRELVATLDYDLETKGIEVCLPHDLPTVYLAQNRIRQVFGNLLDNAVKYMKTDGEKRIRVEYGYDHAHKMHQFTVADTGCGIPVEDQPRVFQVFSRAANVETSTTSGKGIGLATVKSIIETLGGQIWVESQPGAGSAFHFTVDGRKVAPPSPAQQSA